MIPILKKLVFFFHFYVGSIRVFNQDNPEIAEDIVTLAYESGINLFDICDPYTAEETERQLGKFRNNSIKCQHNLSKNQTINISRISPSLFRTNFKEKRMAETQLCHFNQNLLAQVSFRI